MKIAHRSFAWLTRRDGYVILGHGPFQQVASPRGVAVAFYKRSFYEERAHRWFVPNRFEIISHQDLCDFLGESESCNIRWQTPEATPFSEVFQEIISAIQTGLIEKTVPVVTEHGLIDKPANQLITTAIGLQKPPLYSYGWHVGENGFAGATPELLVAMSGTRLETMALAGTARQEDAPVFEVDEKEIREHEYVAQTLVSKLQDWGRVNREKREVLRLGSIVHFLSRIHVDLTKEIDPERLIARLHPTPALGPLPRTEVTMEKLEEWRQRLSCPAEFGAPFGCIFKGDFEAVVAIRGIWWNGSEVILPAGCGIIEASRLVNEWHELRLKRESVKRFLES